MRLALCFVIAACLGAGAGGCESVDHESIDKWGHTQKGPGKLLSTLKSSEHSAELRGHAAQVLIDIGKFSEIKDVLEELEDKARHKIVADLSGRLWEVARINDAMAVPSARQSSAKDALFYTIDLADSATQVKIADYLVEWFVGGHYEGRATVGRVSGAMAIRRVGEPASQRLLNSARAIVAIAPDAEGRRTQLGTELLKALALTGSADALGFLMDLVDKPRGDTSLPNRAISALHFAFVEPLGFEAVNGEVVASIAKRLEDMFYDEGLSGTMRNDAVALLASMSPNDCIPVFTRMISYPSDRGEYRWMGTQQGVRCGAEQGIEAITEALPASVNYERGLLSKYLWDEILLFKDKKKIATAAASLLQSKSWVSRVTGIELLGQLKTKGDVAENTKLITSLASDQHKLKNWWGTQEGASRAERKSDPTLGQVASNVAKSLAALALEHEGK